MGKVYIPHPDAFNANSGEVKKEENKEIKKEKENEEKKEEKKEKENEEKKREHEEKVKSIKYKYDSFIKLTKAKNIQHELENYMYSKQNSYIHEYINMNMTLNMNMCIKGFEF